MGRKTFRFKSKSKNFNSCCRKQHFRSTTTASCSRANTDDSRTPESETDGYAYQDTQESDIPGYYYDPEKKTYFKILPNHLGCGSGSGFITQDTVNKGKASIRSSQHKGQGARATSSSMCSGTKRPKNQYNSSIFHSLNSAQTGQMSGKKFEHHCLYYRYRDICPNKCWGTFEMILPNFGVHLEALQRMELNSRRDKAVCVWSVQMDMSQKIQLMSISYNRKNEVFSEDRGCFPAKIQPAQSYGVTCSSKISSLCWSPLSLHPGKMCVLYTTIFPFGDFNSKVSISNLEAKERDDVNIFDFSLGRGAVWSSAWNPVNNRFSVGCERKCQVVDVHARRQWVYSTGNSDALAQLFSIENPHLLFSGTRSGNILTHDLRSAGHSHSQVSTKLNQKMPIVCIRSPKDENFLYASDFSGLICKWDLRMQKIVMKYSGLLNSHYQLPFYLDETEHFIYGTGSDGYCKLWDITSGNLVTTITPPDLDFESDCLPIFPVTHFSGCWAGHFGIIGAVTGMGRKFYLSH